MYASSSSAPVDEESASLAYSAIVDGNVLHACFGLRASASGRSSIPTIGGHRDERPSAFCCFPASSSSSGGALDATLQLVLPHLVGNKVRMANLVEMLREVRDLHHEEAYRGDHHVAAAYAAAGAANDATTTAGAKEAPLYVRVIRAYVRCFTAIVGYHDARRELVGKNDAAVVATTGDGGAGGRTTRGGGGDRRTLRQGFREVLREAEDRSEARNAASGRPYGNLDRFHRTGGGYFAEPGEYGHRERHYHGHVLRRGVDVIGCRKRGKEVVGFWKNVSCRSYSYMMDRRRVGPCAAQ